MGQEIERKFLVSGDGWRAGEGPLVCRQGYLAVSDRYTVRVRLLGDRGFLTIKGSMEGITRAEYEYGIPAGEANEILEHLCLRPLVEKYRYRRTYGGKTWEIDEFTGENQGLILAEIELDSDDQDIAIPDWVGREVTGDPRYLNQNLARQPYSGKDSFKTR